ncbi:UDP-glucose--hexose-1-phosphate uridylyltransferase [Pseudofrankia inefficax]|uniref:Galactose-1-phosphate uridylyltransferase n=1 Tax=Pseudofrankia inefficax (strain DSM 45817 / CECT 9037 / DDB 130130 / EuI1c) TaxID=298654 RepID=E3IY03_PSEI1|nr:UDP-glucose--hexose-1-phosphate uridylyltransferase [Pseudofrankia inefficax]ADP81458.1 galactose-1-phosphate uridylyltransferase [Pseudofrankia inefficax]
MHALTPHPPGGEPPDAPPPSHRRFDPLRGRWILVSAGRDRRPWSGDSQAVSPPEAVSHDAACPLCPGNLRNLGDPGGGGGPELRNPAYVGPYVFTNDFPALRPDADRTLTDQDRRAASILTVGGIDVGELLRSEPEAGVCRVLCFGPRHDRHLAAMSDGELGAVVDTWVDQATELARQWRWVQIFENRGAAMGASSPHPHGQVWASASLPDEPAAEDARQLGYLRRHGRRLLVDYAEIERAAGERVVAANSAWLAVVPYWAVWPFETMLVPVRPVAGLPELDHELRASLVVIIRTLLAAYDGLFGVPFPYSMGWHGAPGPADSSPARSGAPDHWQLHAHFYPPLLRSASVRKFLVGYEMLAGAQRDITPERAAAMLRAVVGSS